VQPRRDSGRLPLVVVALGGNALLQRGQAPSAENQRENVRRAARALAELARDHRLVVSHGNGPQVGLLAMQSAFAGADPYPLDVLGAESEGMIGYLVEQELRNALPRGRRIATLLTQVEVDPDDPAFGAPSKPIGPHFEPAEAERLARERGWTLALRDGKLRRVVPSPAPLDFHEMDVIRLLVEHDVVVVCGGGGGIPTARGADGRSHGVEAVVDKDRLSALLATKLRADAFLMLTDVDAVWRDWGGPGARPIRRASPAALRALDFEAGSMGPKVESALAYVEAVGGSAGIGRLEDARALLDGAAGTRITRDADGVEYGG